jgi:Schlafen, AlbA_2
MWQRVGIKLAVDALRLAGSHLIHFMSIFTKPLSQVTFADLQELLQDAAVENIRLEFKSKVPSKDETLKKLSSFANTFGGFMIVGAVEKDGRLIGLPGVDEEAGYKQKVVQWCFDAVSPPLMLGVSEAIPVPAPALTSAAPTSAAPGATPTPAVPVTKYCYVISTVESDLAPHFLNGRKGVWVRSDEFSQRYAPVLADEKEIRHLLNRRQLIQERRNESVRRSQARFQTFLSRQAKGDGTHRSAARLELSLGPRFPARPVCEQTKLAHELRECRVKWRQIGFPYASLSVVSQHESALILTAKDARNRCELIEANVWGMLFYGVELDIEIGPKQTGGLVVTSTTGIHLYRLVGYLLVFVQHATQLMSGLGYAGPLSIEIALSGIRDVPWLYSENNSLMTGPISELDDGFSFDLQTTSDELRDRRDGLVMNMLQYILFGMNWSEYASDPKLLEDLMTAGYGYNFWGQPAALKL